MLQYRQRKVDDGVIKIAISIVFMLIVLFSVKIFLSGCRIVGRHLNLDLYWKDSWLHKVLNCAGKIRISKAIECISIVGVCCLSIFINPVIVQADKTGKENVNMMAQDEGISKIEGDGKVATPDKPKETEVKETKESKEEVKGIETKEETIETAKTAEKTVEEKKPEEEIKPSAWQDIPLCETVSPVKTYMDDVKITATASEQWKLFNEAKYGEVITDEIGFQYIEGIDPDTGKPMKFYTVALGTYYMSRIGEKFRVTMENGFQFGVITGDMKSNSHTHAGNNSNNVKREGFNPNYCVAGSNDMLEFIIDAEKMKQTYPGRNGLANNGTMNANFDEEHMFEGRITKIELLVEE